MATEPPCPICQSGTRKAFNNRILMRHDVSYFLCERCGFLRTEPPYWLEEAYANPIAREDVDLVGRNLRNARLLTCVLPFLFGLDASVLDCGGGYGLLTRLMRDNGFAFLSTDRYCTNLFASEFEWDHRTGAFDAVTAFEVLEHLEDPLPFIRESMALTSTKTMIFSTELFAGSAPLPDRWSYYAPDAGQHISFFQARTFRVIAESLGVRFYTHHGMHILTPRLLASGMLEILTGPMSHLLSHVFRQASQRRRRRERGQIRTSDSGSPSTPR